MIFRKEFIFEEKKTDCEEKLQTTKHGKLPSRQSQLNQKKSNKFCFIDQYWSTSLKGGVIFMQKAYYLHAPHLTRSKKPHIVCVPK